MERQGHCTGGRDSLKMYAPNSDRIDYWISVAKRTKNLIITAL